RLRCGHLMRAAIATPLAINQSLSKYYAPGMRENVESKSAEGAGKGKKGGTAKSTTKAVKAVEPAPQMERMSQLSEGDQRQRKQIGIIIMCWATFGSVMIDQFVLKPMLFPKWTVLFALTLFIPPF